MSGREDMIWVRFELGQGEEKLLIIGHYDTVHLIGAIQYRTEGDRLYGLVFRI